VLFCLFAFFYLYISVVLFFVVVCLFCFFAFLRGGGGEIIRNTEQYRLPYFTSSFIVFVVFAFVVVAVCCLLFAVCY